MAKQLHVTVTIDAPEDADGTDVDRFVRDVAQACIGSAAFNLNYQGHLVGFVGEGQGLPTVRKSVRIR